MDHTPARTLLIILTAITLPISSWADESVVYQVKLKSQPLSDALKTFADQTGLQVMFFSEVTDGVQTIALNGDYTATAALDTLLSSSGLTYEYINEKAITVRAIDAISEAERGASDSKNLTPTPVLMEQNQTSPTRTTSRNEEGGTSIVTGKVTDARTGANLKGAKVTIEETGQWTSTSDLGKFRFASVPSGSVTLTVSFLGYAEQSATIGVRGGSVEQDFALRGGSEIEEIVVFGQRSARAQALNLERTAENVMTVVSSDMLGGLPGSTIAETLRRAPGVAFERSGLTGDGANIIVRGLAPEFNFVTLNGMRLPDTSGIGRAPNLENVQTESISNVTISKTLLPNQDSFGTGGLVEIVTKSPLDRPERFASLDVSHGAARNDFLDDTSISGTISGTFGNNRNFGFSASVQYRDRELNRLSYSLGAAFGQYLPLAEDGTVITSRNQIDPRTPFPFEAGVDEVYPIQVNNNYSGAATEDLSATLSAQWQVGGHTDLRFDYQRLDRTTDSFIRSQSLLTVQSYEPLLIDALDGETRGALVWERPDGTLAVAPSQEYNFVSGSENVTNIYSLRGETKAGNWKFNYKAGHASGRNNTPQESLSFRPTTFFFQEIDHSYLSDEALANTIDGRIVSPYAPLAGRGYVLPEFNEQGFAALNEPNNLILLFGSIRNSSGKNERDTIELSARYDFESSVVEYIEFGVFFDEARFANEVERDARGITASTFLFPTVADLELQFAGTSLSAIGLSGGFDVLRTSELRDLIANIDSNTLLTTFDVPNTPFLGETGTKEENLAFYLQGRVEVGNWEFIGGGRLDRIDVSATNSRFPVLIDENGEIDAEFNFSFAELIRDQADQIRFLPRLLANYRPGENLIFRLGYFQSVARPRIEQLSATQTIRLDLQTIHGPNGDQPTIVVGEGNPDLKPAVTNSFDVSLEYYDDRIGVAKVGVFYKDIDNLLENNQTIGFDVLDGVDVPNDPKFTDLPANIFVVGNRPENSKFSASIWGVETSIEQQFTFLPGVWSGLGGFANYTYTDSEKTESVTFSGSPSGNVLVGGVRFNESPKHQGTVALTYGYNNIDANLSFTKQGIRQLGFGRNGIGFFEEEVETLDLRIEYRTEGVGALWRVYFEGVDLLKGTRDASLETFSGGSSGVRDIVNNASFIGGRQYRLGVSATF